MLEVFKVGTAVFVGGDIPATITAVTIRDGVKYECVWWDNRTRRIEWIEAYELTAANADTIRIGFKSGQAPE